MREAHSKNVEPGKHLRNMHPVAKDVLRATHHMLDEEGYRDLFENAPLAIFQSTPDGKIISVNPSFASLFGYDSPADVYATVKDIGSELYVDPARRPEILHLQIENPTIKNFESLYRRKDGSSFVGRITLRAIYDADGQIAYLEGFIEDVTEIRNAEEALRASETILRAFFNAIGESLLLMELDGTVLAANDTTCLRLGLQPDELIGKNAYQPLPANVAEYRRQFAELTRATAQPQQFEDQRLGRWIENSIYPVIDAQGRVQRLAIYGQDITARKKIESMLWALLQLSQFATSHSLDEVIQKALDDAEALTESQIGFFHFLKPDQVTLWLQMWSTNTLKNMCSAAGKGLHYPVDQAGVWVDCVHTRAPVIHNDYANLEHRKGMPDGHAPVVRELTIPVVRDGLIVAIIGVGNKATDYDEKDIEIVSQLANLAWDVIQRKQFEDALQLSEERHRRISEMISDYAYAFNVAADNSLALEWVTGGFERITGFSPEEGVGGWATLIYPEDMPIAQERGKRLLAGQDDASEFRIVCKDGRIRWLRDHGKPVWSEGLGRVVRIYGAAQDITERKLAEREHELTVRLLQRLNKNNGLFELMKDIVALLQEWSGCEAVGIRLRQGDDYPYYVTSGFPAFFVEKENQLCAYDLQGQILRDEVGNPVLECMCGNILRGRIDLAKPFFTVHGSFWTNSTTQLLASTSEADRQARTRNRCNGEGYESVALIPLRTAEQTFGLLQFNDTRPGRFTPDEIALYEQLASSLALALAQRQADEALRASLTEKETLLKEVHHRVKNNLAAITSLIGLQQDNLADPTARAALEDLSGRVHSMALVHELLYQSQKVSQIDLQDYLTTLVARLHAVYGSQATVNWHVAAEGVALSLDNAIPCGLIVNELVTNAFKYAFPGGQPRPDQDTCEIAICAAWDGQAYILSVKDNGIGLPDDFDLEKSPSLGLQLVAMLGQRQLNGQVEWERSGGTTFRLRFLGTALHHG